MFKALGQGEEPGQERGFLAHLATSKLRLPKSAGPAILFSGHSADP